MRSTVVGAERRLSSHVTKRQERGWDGSSNYLMESADHCSFQLSNYNHIDLTPNSFPYLNPMLS